MQSERSQAPAGESSAGPPDARTAEIAAWLGQLWRTLKTCRLYGATNVNAIQFREHLAAQLNAHLERHGSFRLLFGAHEVSCDGHVLVKSLNRDDNIAMPFYRDGLRSLTFNPGMEAAELGELLDLLLRVTSRGSEGTDDLVTLLWDRDLPHLDMSYVSSETDADLGDDGPDPFAEALGTRQVELIPWPGGAPGGHGGGPSAASPSDAAGDGNGGSGGGAGGDGKGGEAGPPAGPVLADDTSGTLRSEDWLAGEPAHDLEERYRALDAAGAGEVERFLADAERERGQGMATATVALVRDAMDAGVPEGGHVELADLLTRALHEAIAAAAWPIAHDAVDGLIHVTEGRWEPASLIEALARPDSSATTSLIRHLESGLLSDTQQFAEFARSLGPVTAEWLMSIVAASNQQRTRRLLVKTLGELCDGNPERLAPWLADPRWYVVRNAVLVMGSGEGGVPPGLMRPLLHHAEPRVRAEVVRALAGTDPEPARPLLLELVRDAEPGIRNAALHELGLHRHPDSSALLVQLIGEHDFHKRPIEDVRPVLGALGGCAGDEALAHLEAQLHAPGARDKHAAPFRQAVARCIARIGTPEAVALLQRGSESRTAGVREACQLVIRGSGRG